MISRSALAVLSITGILFGPGIGNARMDFGRVAPLSATAATDTVAPDGDAAIATDGDGVWVAAWGEGAGGALGITGGAASVFSRSADDGVTWSPVSLVRPEVADDWVGNPAVATDTNGKWLLVWGPTPYELRVATSTDNGQSWGAPSVLVSSGSNRSHFLPKIETDRSGTWVIAWNSNDSLAGTIGEEGDVLFSRSTDDGATWSAPAPLNANAAGDVAGDGLVRFATDHVGTWVAGWSASGQAQYARSTDNGATWAAPASLGPFGSAGSSGPDVATDGEGRWVAAWSNNVDNSGVYDDLDIWFSYSTDNGATWSTGSRLHPTMDAASLRGDHQPRVVFVGGGLWSVAWISNDNFGRAIGDELDVQISTSRDGGVSWSSPAMVTSRARVGVQAVDLQPAIASSPTGRTLLLWESDDSLDGTIGTDWDILIASAHRDCDVTARVDCRPPTSPAGSSLKVKDGDGGSDLLQWRWRSSSPTSDADIGDPTATDAYVVCLYETLDGAPGLIGEWDVQAGTTCAGVPCWTKTAGKIAFKDRDLENGSIKQLHLSSSDTGKSKIRLKASGFTVAPPRLPLATTAPVRIQFVNLGTGVCWEGVHDQAVKNDAQQFVSISD